MALSHKDFFYYVEMNPAHWRRFAHILQGEDVLISFIHLTKKKDPRRTFTEELKKHSGRVMIDSGGFSNFTRPGTVRFDEWAEYVKDAKSWCDEYVTFDDLGSRSRTLKFFAKARKLGLDPLFVDHLWMRTQRTEVDAIWKSADKLCLSGFARTLPTQKPFPGDPKARVHEAFEKGREHKTSTHLLAVSSLRRFLPYLDRVHSVDSAGWAKGAAFGAVLIFDPEDLGGGLVVPRVRAYRYPGGTSETNAVLSADQKRESWDYPLRKFKVPTHWALPQRAKAVSLWNLKRYIKAVKKVDPDDLRKRIAQRAEEKKVSKSTTYFFLDGDDFDFDGMEPVEKKKAEAEIDRDEIKGYLDQAGDFVVVPEFVSLVGSMVTGDPETPPQDVDLLVRGLQPDPKIELKLDRIFPPEVREHVSIIFDPQGPNWDSLPLYDLVCRRRTDDQVKAVDEPGYKPFPSRHPVTKATVRVGRPFTPLKARGGYHLGEFFDLGPLWDLWVDPNLKSGKSIAVEPKYDGIRFTVHKDGDKVWVFTEDEKRDRAEILVDVVEEVKGLKPDRLILDGELVKWEKGQPLARHDMMDLVVGKDPIKGEDLRLNVFDVVWADDESLVDSTWEDRQKALRTVLPEDGKHLRRVRPRVVSNRREFTAALKWARNFVGSEGAMLKLTDSPYDLDGRTGAWAKLKDVFEIKCVVIGVRKKMPTDQEDPKFRSSPGRWTFEGIKDPSAYTYRCAVRGRGGQLVPIEGERTYTDSDLKVRYVKAGDKDPVTGQVASTSGWKGVDDPALWKMGRGFKSRGAGDLEYGITYNTGTEAEIGDVITVSPVLVRDWVGEDGRRHYSWTFPIVREADPTREKPDTVEDLRRIAESSSDRSPEKEPKPEEVQAAALSPSTLRLSYLQKQKRTDLDPDETSREESRELTEALTGDPYQVEQKGAKSYPFVFQYHYRGFWSDEERDQLRKALVRARAARDRGEKDEARTLLKGLWQEFSPLRLKAPVEEIREAANRADDAGEGNVSPTVRRFLDDKVPDLDELDDVEKKIVNLGNVHGDLRMKSPEGNWLVGWTLDTPKTAVQTLGGEATPLLRSMVTDNEPGDNVVSQRKLVQPVSWLKVVTKDKPVKKIGPGDVGSTRGTSAEYHYVDSGEVVFGAQKTDFHEYFFFPKSGKWGGRWGVQLIEGRPDYERVPGEFWITNRPAKTQTPYIQTHDRKVEEEKAKKDKVDLVWNEDTIKALRRKKYPDLADVKKSTGTDADTDERQRVSISIPIVKVAKEERYIMGIVMIPEVADAHGEVTSAEEIRQAAHKFLARGPKIGYQHSETPGGLTLLESYIAPVDFALGTRKIVKGTWLMAVRVDNDKIWKEVKDGTITGFSIEGYARKVPVT